MKELIDIQSQLVAPKNLYHKFGDYYYRNTEGILEAIKPILSVHGCTLTITDDIVMVGDRFYIKATARITNSAGESAEASAFARETLTKKGMDDAQITGAASSYARKYALNGLFLIDDTKDPDFIDNSAGDNKAGKGATKTTRSASSADAQKTLADRTFEACLKITNAQTLDEIKQYWSDYKALDIAGANGVKPISKAIADRRKQLGV